jgi:TRAP transporter 4TM/12TM fusion protein
MSERFRPSVIRALSVLLCLFTVAEVNYPYLTPISRLAVFALFGLSLSFLAFPVLPRWRESRIARVTDWLLVLLTVVTCGYLAVQNQPAFRSLWQGGRSLGERAGAETALDHAVGIVGLLLVLEAARRTVGLALPVLSLLFLAYARYGQAMPDWLFPHRGYGLERIVGQTFLHSQGVFGVALYVMFTYVFLFVVFGSLLETTGATRFLIDGARRILGRSAGGPAKVSILSSGLMGSLSGSAVANTATTGTFTIPLMRSAGFKPHVAAGIEAAASSGGALVPPVMGAGAYMMLEIVDPPVTYLEILRAAVLPAILYYLALFLIAHFSARRLEDRGGSPGSGVGSADRTEGAVNEGDEAGEDGAGADDTGEPPGRLEGVIFFGSLAALVFFLLSGFTVFRSVTLAMAATLVLSFGSARTRLTPQRLLDALERSARSGVALVAAAACVGIVLGVVTLTGVGSKLPSTLLPLAEDSLFLALLLLMASSIVLGMGLPSAVCYLLLATLVGPVLGDLGVVPLAAHLFIFYFGLMSMVTPPVALAAYTAASIAGSGILRTSFAAFRFALIGFFLPFLFVYRPQLLMLAADGSPASAFDVALAFAVAGLAILPLAAAIAGYLGRPLGPLPRLLLLVAAAGLLYPGDHGFFPSLPISLPNLLGAAFLAAIYLFERRRG